MTLLQLDVEGFRSIRQARLEFAPQQNLILGANASGKTSLLEAIYILGTGRSFRTHQTELLIAQGQDQFLAIAKVNGVGNYDILGVRGTRSGKEFRINGEPGHSLADLARNLPVQVIDPDVHRLLEDGPIRRRHFLDWGVFHVEPRFNDSWRRYQRALRQRNMALRSKQSLREIAIWDQELIENGKAVAGYREQYIADLQPFITALGDSVLGLNVEIEHQRGWKRGSEFVTALIDALPRDRERGITTVGAHRADLSLKVAGLTAKDRVSRGQQKLLACTLLLAQQAHRAATGASPACLLLDDPAAELDVDNLKKLLSAIATSPAQLIVTSLSKIVLDFFPEARLFHVEQGCVHSGIMT